MEFLKLSPLMLTLIALGLVVVAAGFAWIVGSLAGRLGKRHDLDAQRTQSTRWATKDQVKALMGGADDPRRMRLCVLDKALLHVPNLRSVMVIAPTGAGKTPRVVVPIVLCHIGPAVVTSVKGDVLELTQAARKTSGQVYLFDPTNSAQKGTSRWSPLAHVRTWGDAINAARAIQESVKNLGKQGIEDATYWNTQARLLLAPLIYLAARQGRTIRDVASLVSGGDESQRMVTVGLKHLGERGALEDWIRFVQLEHRTQSNVLSTARTVLEPWTHPDVDDAVNVTSGDPDVLDLDTFLDGANTLYLVAPAGSQEHFTPIYETLVNALIQRFEAAYAAQGTGLPVSPPLLLALDEAANIAPVRTLGRLASAGAGQGILVLTVWQDEGQIVERYGEPVARTIMSNHFAKIYLPGIADPRTLQSLSELIGSDEFLQRSVTSAGERVSTTITRHEAQIAPPRWLRQLAPNEVIVVAGSLPPIRGTLPAWYEDPKLRAQIPRDVAAAFDNAYGGKPAHQKGRGLARQAVTVAPQTQVKIPTASEPNGHDRQPGDQTAYWFGEDVRRKMQ